MEIKNYRTFSSPVLGSVVVIDIGDKVWFSADDVTRVLGYTNQKQAITNHVLEPNKQFVKDETCDYSYIIRIGAIFIDQTGLDDLIHKCKLMDSGKPKFWLLYELLPWALKTAEFIKKKEKIVNGNLEIQEVAFPKPSVDVFQDMFKEQRDKNIKKKPKDYNDLIQRYKKPVSLSVIAGDYGWSAAQMNEYLQDLGVQHRENGTWALNKKYANKGYTKTKMFEIKKYGYLKCIKQKNRKRHKTVFTSTFWTQQGRRFIYVILKQHGILPLMEQ